MWHASEGDLHAYLDGAQDDHPPDETERIREHLAGCTSCAERLAAEELIRERASSVLAWATPGEVELPPLEELRRRAATSEGEKGRPVPGSTVPARVAWAWAATVVLALGIGWGVGGSRFLGPDRPPGPSSTAPAVAQGVAAEPGSDSEDRSGSPGERERTRLAEIAAPRTVVPPAPASLAEREVAEAPAPPVPVREVAPSQARRRVDVSAARLGSVERVDGQERLPAEFRAAGEAAPPSADLAGVLENSPSAEGAAPLTIPGLEVESVEWVQMGGQQGVRVVQRSADGTPLELRFLVVSEREVAEEAPLLEFLDEPLPQAWRQVSVSFRRGWLVARSPLSEARLRALLEGIR